MQLLKPVMETREFHRVRNLPTKANTPFDLDIIHKPSGTMKAWSEQIEALEQAKAAKGLFAPMGVGAGKTLVCWLLPTVLNAPNAVILTEAKLVAQMLAERDKYAPHFNIRDDIEVKSYDWISHANNQDYLAARRPSVIIADEGHALRNPSAVRVKRFLNYVYENEDCMFCVLSGTITKRSLKDFGHLAERALRDGNFMPNAYAEAAAWAEALDPPRMGPPRPAGALLRLMPHDTDEGGKQKRARMQFQRRMAASRGVMASTESALGSPLKIKYEKWNHSAEVKKAIKNLDKVWERPDGWELVDILDKARIMRSLFVGGYYRFKNPTEEQLELLRLRADMSKQVHAWLKSHRSSPIDSPGLLLKAVRQQSAPGQHVGPVVGNSAVNEAVKAHDVLAERVELPETEWVWVCKEFMFEVIAWALRRRVCIFTDQVEFGRELADWGGWPYYGAGEKASKDILGETGRRCIVASYHAHGTGRNLQMFSDALVLAGIPNGETWEQLLGRLHRPGQVADIVTYHVPSFFEDDVDRAKVDSKYIQGTLGNKQKLLMARYE